VQCLGNALVVKFWINKNYMLADPEENGMKLTLGKICPHYDDSKDGKCPCKQTYLRDWL
jgi:hypothetical protein